ncbi:hypothetical protein ACFVQ4_34285 [Streptomyces laurentii]|uniref:hypothetical protein n=1 Tax=Streptomyces laurentii TaxID=39478 RepID=UPI0036A19694
MSLSKYTKDKPYLKTGFPDPISSQGSRIRLYDADQVAAHLAGLPVPELPAAGDDHDLLDRREAAALIGVALASWDVYKNRPALAEHCVLAGGVEHWPRHVILTFHANPGRKKGGRPKGAGDMVPRDQLHDRVRPFLDADPAVGSAHIADTLGVHRDVAQRALIHLRARHIADLLEHDPTLTPEQAADTLGYPTAVRRAALAQAAVELRARAAAAYLADITAALHTAGLTATDQPPAIEQKDATLRATLPLDHPTARALVWEEQAGWRTAGRRRHPYTDLDTRPLLTGNTHPTPTELLTVLRG